MNRVLIVIGHDFNETGAFNEYLNKTEYECNLDIGTQVFKKNNISELEIILKNRTKLKYIANEINSINPDLIISIHLNAFNKHVQGSEVLYWHSSKSGEKFAKKMQSKILENINYKDRGIRPIKDNQRGSFLLKNTKATCILIEPFFIDSIKSIEELNDNISKTASAILEFLKEVV